MKLNAAFASLPRWKVVASGASVALCILTACNDPIVFTSSNVGISNPASGYTWHGPYPLDLGDVRNASDFTHDVFYDGNNAFFSILPPATITYVGQSYGTFNLASNATIGTMAVSLFDGQHFRPFGRVYNPVSLGGSGWAPYGPQASFLDTASTEDALYMALGLSATGAGLAVYSDGVTSANTGNAALSGSGAWHGLTTQVGTNLTTAPGQGYFQSPSALAGYYANGSSSAVGWDQGGHAYYSYVDHNDANLAGYLSTYNAFTNWSLFPGPGTGLGNGMRLGPLVSQNQLVSDGYGVTALWVGEDTMHATAVALGDTHGCAIGTAGQVYCWGDNSFDQIGNSSEASNAGTYPAPASIPGYVTSLSAGFQHSCAITEAGTTLCWGSNVNGELGIGTTSTAQPTPSIVSGLPGIPSQIVAGSNFTCALLSDKTVSCWGAFSNGQLGNPGLLSDLSAPASSFRVTGLTGTVTKIAAGSTHACALISDGTVDCWGNNLLNQLGGFVGAQSATANAVTGLTAAVTQISAGKDSTCALLSDKTVSCWGDNGFDQIGNAGVGASASTATQATGIAGATQIAVGASHACALLSTGGVSCWGDNAMNELNAGGVPAATTAKVSIGIPLGMTITAISAGDQDTCMLTNQGTLLCWGNNAKQQVNGTSGTPVTAPLELPATAHQAVHSYWTATPTTPYPTLSTGDVKSMASATDGQGNVVTVYLQSNPNFVTAPSGTITALYPIRNNNVRVYASSRGASGIWTGPTQIDDGAQFSASTTTTYQEAWGRTTGHALNSMAGGIEYFTPGIAYLGGGRFLAAFAMTDLVASTSSIYVRGYSVGNGWDASSQTIQLDSMTFAIHSTSEAYRYANDIALVADGLGDALLMAQVVVPSQDGSNVTLRNYAMKAFTYSASTGWSSGFMIPNSLCRAITTIPVWPNNNFCWDLKPQGMIFPGGEAVVVFPVPASISGTGANNVRLFETEFHL